MIWSLLATVHASCLAEVPATTLDGHGLEVQGAFVEQDLDGLAAAARTALEALPCVSEPLERSTVAAWFRFQGMARFIEGDRNTAVEMFVPARELEPNFRFDDAVLGANHPLRKTYDNVPAEGGPRRDLAPPASGTLSIDGRTGLSVPTDRPYVVQHVRVDGSILSTQLVERGATPTYEPAAVVPPPEPTTPPDTGDAKPPRRLDLTMLPIGYEYTRDRRDGYHTIQGLLGAHVRLTGAFGLELAAPVGVIVMPAAFAWSLRLGPRVSFGDRLRGSVALGVRTGFNSGSGARFVTPAGYAALGVTVPLSDRVGLRIEGTGGVGRSYDPSLAIAVTGGGHAGLNIAL